MPPRLGSGTLTRVLMNYGVVTPIPYRIEHFQSKRMRDFENLNYIVENVPGFTLSEAMRCWHGLFEGELHRFHARVIRHESLENFGTFVAQMWPTLQPLSTAEAFAEKNMEKRRIFFRAIGVKRLFHDLEPLLLDRQVLTIDNQRWDADNKPYTQPLEDVYELYRLDGKKLFPEQFRTVGSGRSVMAEDWQHQRATVYAVRCWCTSTKREYWIYVPTAVGEKRDALEAIAWTVQLNITHPQRLFRQGDIIIAQPSAKSKEVPLYHLDKKAYTTLLVSET